MKQENIMQTELSPEDQSKDAFFEQLARDSGYTLTWQHLDPARNIGASAAIMRGDAEPMRTMLDTLVSGGT